MSIALESPCSHAVPAIVSGSRSDYRVRLVGTLPASRALADLAREFLPGVSKPPLATVIVPGLPGLSISMMRASEGTEKSVHVVGRYPGEGIMPHSEWLREISAFMLRLRAERPELFLEYPGYVEDVR